VRNATGRIIRLSSGPGSRLGRFTHRTADFSAEFEADLADLADLKHLIQEAGDPGT
jgi:hypothetical protein